MIAGTFRFGPDSFGPDDVDRDAVDDAVVVLVDARVGTHTRSRLASGVAEDRRGLPVRADRDDGIGSRLRGAGAESQCRQRQRARGKPSCPIHQVNLRMHQTQPPRLRDGIARATIRALRTGS